MNYKEYLLKQDAVNLKYIASKMWPGNVNAKSYLSTKLNDKGRPWTDSDNQKAEKAIHELGLQLIKDAPNTGEQSIFEKQKATQVKKEAEKEPSLNDLWKKVDKK